MEGTFASLLTRLPDWFFRLSFRLPFRFRRLFFLFLAFFFCSLLLSVGLMADAPLECVADATIALPAADVDVGTIDVPDPRYLAVG